MLFNVVMDKIIDGIPMRLGYRIGQTPMPLECYADKAILIEENEEKVSKII